MRYLRNKEQDKIDSSMGFVWLCSVVIVVPVVLFFQWVMPMVFTAWTRGKIPYDAHLFGVFSITLLIFSLSRPPSAILQGNNLANAQLIINALISVFAIIGVILMTPLFGILGAAYVLLVSELIGLILTMYYGIQWLNKNRLKWNWRLFNASLISVNLAIVGIASIVVMPQYALWELLLFGVFSLYVGLAFLRELPDSAKQKLKVFIVVLEKLRLVKK
jgi:O-antigen/teichoic acid export membrane protein